VSQATGQATQDFGSLAAGSCNYLVVNAGVGDLTGSIVEIFPNGLGSWPSGVVLSPTLSNLVGNFRLRVCNVTAGAIDPPNETFNWIVLKVA
jgi:hypothetical protein